MQCCYHSPSLAFIACVVRIVKKDHHFNFHSLTLIDCVKGSRGHSNNPSTGRMSTCPSVHPCLSYQEELFAIADATRGRRKRAPNIRQHIWVITNPLSMPQTPHQTDDNNVYNLPFSHGRLPTHNNLLQHLGMTKRRCDSHFESIMRKTNILRQFDWTRSQLHFLGEELFSSEKIPLPRDGAPLCFWLVSSEARHMKRDTVYHAGSSWPK